MAVTRRTRVGQPAVDRALDELRDDVDAVRLGQPQLFPGLTWTAGQVRTVRHGLGAIPRSWWPGRPRAGVLQLQEVSRNDTDLTISSATAGTCDLWVTR